VIAGWLAERAILPDANLLDAGCGTGRYATELARQNYVVHGIDLSPELVEIARRSITDGEHVSFDVGNILELPTDRYDAILCRGVLNDLIDDPSREGAFAAFAQALRPAGVLILDVRAWDASAERKAQEPVFRKCVATDRGPLTFTSITQLDPEKRQLLLSERHTLVANGQEHSSNYQFVMRCWTHSELQSCLARYGFGNVAYFGAYDPASKTGDTDRIVVVAQLPAEA